MVTAKPVHHHETSKVGLSCILVLGGGAVEYEVRARIMTDELGSLPSSHEGDGRNLKALAIMLSHLEAVAQRMIGGLERGSNHVNHFASITKKILSNYIRTSHMLCEADVVKRIVRFCNELCRDNDIVTAECNKSVRE